MMASGSTSSLSLLETYVGFTGDNAGDILSLFGLALDGRTYPDTIVFKLEAEGTAYRVTHVALDGTFSFSPAVLVTLEFLTE